MNQIQQLQSALIQRIQQIKDTRFLQEITLFLEKKDPGSYELQAWQKEMLDKADEEFARGEVVSNEEVFAQAREWLKDQKDK